MKYKYLLSKLIIRCNLYFCHMKNSLLVLSTLLIFSSCGGGNDLSDPNIVAENFLKSYISMDYEEAKKYASKEFIGLLDQYQSEKELLAAEVIKESEAATVEIKNMEIKEAEGVAIVKFSNSQLPDIVDQLELRKVEDSWYANNVERTVDVELDNKFPDEEIEKMIEEAEEQEETMPVEESEG